MSGHVSGVATRLKAEQPAALHVHCLAHSLNLCLQDATRTCICIRDTIEMIRELVKLIKYSPKRTALFEKIQVQVSPDTGPSMLKPLCPTRWTVQTGAISAALDNYSVLLACLEEVHATGRDEYAMKAGVFKR